MLTLFRWLLMLTVGLLAVTVGAVVLVWYFAIRSVPDYSASHAVQGLSAPVEIVRSTENVPHIFGSSDSDVFMALGFAHAQDRLFQMTALRRAAQGRLAEIYGPRAFDADDLARRMGYYRLGRAALAAQTPQARAALTAYAQGVNQWIAQVNKGALGRGAPEFFLYPDQIAYWQPADSLAILKLVAASASGALGDEVLRARLSLAAPAHGPDILAQPGDAPLPDYASLFPGARFFAPEPGRPDRPAPLGFVVPGAGLGGTGFAVAPDHTAAGGAILANDPQGLLSAPGLWYLARLDLAQGGVIGATIPGIPAVLSGRNPHLAWGLTPAGIDDTDVAIEEVQPGNHNRYRGADGWRDFATRTELIRVLDQPARQITLRETDHGPVVPGTLMDLAQITPQGHVAAIRWAGAQADDASYSALLALMGAPDRATATRAMAAMVAPAVQVTLADGGGVAQIMAGHLPDRAPDHQTGGALPTPGWVAANAWRGTRPATEPGGATAQGPVVMAAGGGAHDPRLARLTRLMDSREIHSRDSLIAAQLDTVSPVARALLPLVGADLWFTGEPAAPGTIERRRQDALGLLAEWDGNMNEHLPEPLIYAAWMTALQDRLIRDDIGPLADALTAPRPAFIEAVFRNRNGAARWCDVVQSAPVETCATIARQALDTALIDLAARYGTDVASYRWGDAHQAVHENPALGALPGLGWVMNITQSVSGGDFTLAQSGLAHDGAAPWRAISGAGYRGVYDLADPDSSVFVIATGQSGHPLSRHYDDLSGLWRRGEYVGMSLDPALARAAAVGVTTLTPAP